MKILVMGMGAIGHSLVANSPESVIVDVLVSNYVTEGEVTDTNGNSHEINKCYTYNTINKIDHDYLLVTLPFRYKISRLMEIKDKISPQTTLVIVPANQGMYNFIDIKLRERNPMILLERVPFISRVVDHHKSVKIFGQRDDMHVCAVNNANIELFKDTFKFFGNLCNHRSPYEISLISSNASLHTSRIYDLFEHTNNYNKEVLFYEEWTEFAANLFINLENEVLAIKDAIEQEYNLNLHVYDMYEHFKIHPVTTENVVTKLSTFNGFLGISFYAKDQHDLISNRYLVDDCILGTYYFIKLGEKYHVKTDNFKLIYNWATKLLGSEINEIKALDL